VTICDNVIAGGG